MSPFLTSPRPPLCPGRQVLRRELQAAQVEAAQVKVLRQHVANIDVLREQLASEEARCR